MERRGAVRAVKTGLGMGRIVPFKKSRRRLGKQIVLVKGRRQGARSARVSLAPILMSAMAFGAFVFWHSGGFEAEADASTSTHFTVCGSGPRYNCVVDGDTLYYRGEKIRVADINTPEIQGADCQQEARLGERAKFRFLELLNSGHVYVEHWGARDRDQYGRQLRVVMRDGRSLGDDLIAEGLARRWSGRRGSWCT
jgi:endonuclease YncB( thermonuclease family)